MQHGHELRASLGGNYSDEDELIEYSKNTINSIAPILGLDGCGVEIYMEEDGQGFIITLDRTLTEDEEKETLEALEPLALENDWLITWDEDLTSQLYVDTWRLDVDWAY